VFVPRGSYAADVILDRPRAYWPLDDVDSLARDYSGEGHHGLYTGGVALRSGGALGVRDRHAEFDPTGGAVSVDVPGLPMHGRSMTTVELWLRPRAQMAPGLPFAFRNYGLDLKLPFLGFTTGNGGDLLGASIAKLAGRWHYVVAEFCSGSIRCSRLYVDGKAIAVRQLLGEAVVRQVSGVARISGWPTAPGEVFQGGIEQVAVYGYALPPARIRVHYEDAVRRRAG
jgi:hypothetical protein